MKHLYAFRRSCILFYRRFDYIFILFFRFMIAFFTLLLINLKIGYMEILGNVFIIVAVAVVCALMPLAATASAGIVFIILNSFALNLFVGIFAACIFAVIFIFVMRFITEDSLSLILAPITLSLGFPAVVPVALGLLRGTLSVLSGICAVFAWCFLDSVPVIAGYIQTEDPSGIEVLQRLIDSVFFHEDLVIYCICFSVTILAVYLIRNIIVKYGFLVAAAAGCLVFLIVRLVSCIAAGVETDLGAELAGTAISLAVSLVLTFFFFSLDYKRTKYLQFQDDEYFYIVRAVPKKGAVRKRTVFYDENDDTENGSEAETKKNNNKVRKTDNNGSAHKRKAFIAPDLSDKGEMPDIGIIKNDSVSGGGDTVILAKKEPSSEIDADGKEKEL